MCWKEFEDTFDVSLDNITDAQWFQLCYIARGKIRGMCVAYSIEDYKDIILSELMRWFEEKKHGMFDYEVDWAMEIKREVQDVFKEVEVG